MSDTSTQMRPVLALTIGDSAGIGPEMVLKTLGDSEVYEVARLLVVGDPVLLEARAKRLGVPYGLVGVPSGRELISRGLSAGVLEGVAPGAKEKVMGRVSATAGRASMLWIKEAAEHAISGDVDGMVTAPINKLSTKRGRFEYPGHTEFLGQLAGAEPVMMLVGGGLRVAVVTRHCALRQVGNLLTEAEIIRTVRVVAKSMVIDFGVTTPRIGVLALNPHASEGGRFGDEEKTIIVPAIEKLVAEGIQAVGPVVPDVAFWYALKGEYDAIVAMYHDQGLIPIKTLAFDQGVNATLGLPIVRTSPDHGTAFDIAGTGKASHTSFKEAIKLCAIMVRNRSRLSVQ